jgi:hypothetical protein
MLGHTHDGHALDTVVTWTVKTSSRGLNVSVASIFLTRSSVT